MTTVAFRSLPRTAQASELDLMPLVMQKVKVKTKKRRKEGIIHICDIKD